MYLGRERWRQLHLPFLPLANLCEMLEHTITGVSMIWLHFMGSAGLVNNYATEVEASTSVGI